MKKAVITSLVVALVLVGSLRGKEPEAKEPIKVGSIHPLTGVFAGLGAAANKGIELFFQTVGWQVAGREIIMFTEDTEAKGDVGLNKTKKLVESDKVDVLIGPVGTHVAYAIRDYVDSQKIPLVITIAGAPNLTMKPEMFSPYIICQAESAEVFMPILGTFAFEQLGLRKISSFFCDISVGYECSKAFAKAFEKAGGKLLGETATPFPSGDYSAYIAKIDPKKIDGVHAFYAGADAVRFIKQYADYGLKDQLPLLGFYTIAEEISLEAMGDAVVGVYTSSPYVWTLSTPANKEFRSAYETRYNEKPARYSELGYAAAAVIYQGLEKTGGDTETTKFLAAMKNLTVDVPRGRIRFDERSRVVSNCYITKVIKKNGVLQHEVIKTYEGLREER